MGSMGPAPSAGELANGLDFQPMGEGVTVSGGLTLTNQNGQQEFVAGFSTEVDYNADGQVVPKVVRTSLGEDDNGRVIQDNGQEDMDQHDGSSSTVGSVRIVIGKEGEKCGGGSLDSGLDVSQEELEGGSSDSSGRGSLDSGLGLGVSQEKLGGGSSDSGFRTSQKCVGVPSEYGLGISQTSHQTGRPSHPKVIPQPQRPRCDPDPEFQIFVKNLDGKTYTFLVRASYLVDKLKELIHKKIGMPPSQQRLVANGHNLKEGQRLSEFGVKEHSTVYIQGRLRGGNK